MNHGISTNSPWFGIRPGDSWTTVDTSSVGTQTMQPPPPVPVGQHVHLTKTGEGEFIMQGDLRTLIEYFEQAPEIWLRLMALKGDDNDKK